MRTAGHEDAFDAIGGSLDGLTTLGTPGGSGYCLESSRCVTVSYGISEGGEPCETLMRWDGTHVLAVFSGGGIRIEPCDGPS